jgi:RimJ/RimL family protein N-acetyltransferase
VTVTLHRATLDDVGFLVELFAHEDVAPFLAALRSTTAEELTQDLERADAEPEAYGVLVVEVAGEPAGTVTWECVNRRSRIASVSAYAIDPDRRGEGLGVPAARAIQRHLIRERGFHRLQMEVYAFNERALRHAERAGWIREGVRRKAYLRDGAWVDGILFGLVEEDLDDPAAAESPARSPG